MIRSQDFLKEIEEKLEVMDIDKRIFFVLDKIREIIPYDYADYIKVNKELNGFISIKNTTHFYSLEEDSIISQCYETLQPLIVNDVEMSLAYNRKIDSLSKKKIAKILVFPFIYTRTKELKGIFWLSMESGSIPKFIQDDIDDLNKLTSSISGFLFQNITKDEKQENEVKEYKAQIEKLEQEKKRDQDYFASIIHDIRTPMNVVLGFMELLLLNEEDETKKTYIEASYKSGEHMISLINDVLDMAKVSSGKMTIAKALFSPVDELSDMAKLFTLNMERKNIYFSIYIDPKLPTFINSDLYRIKQIINNLLSNAMKFTPVDGKIMFESLYNEKEDTLSISVIDTGIGIDKDKQKNLFNPYMQEDETTAQNYGGTGLGLAISKQLSILLDGKISLKSEKGKGSDFTLVIPCETPKPITQKINQKTFENIKIYIFFNKDIKYRFDTLYHYFNDLNIDYEHVETLFEIEKQKEHSFLLLDREDIKSNIISIANLIKKDIKILIIERTIIEEECLFKDKSKSIHYPILPNNLFETIELFINPNKEKKLNDDVKNHDIIRGHTVLVVDDNVINLKLIEEVLKKFELKVTTSFKPKETLETIKNNSFDILLIDENMPGINGSEVIKLIREYEKSINTTSPIVIYGLTGDADDELREKMIGSGANDVYTKPIKMQQIFDAIVKGVLKE